MYAAVLIILLLIIILTDVFFFFHLKRKEYKPIYLYLHIVPGIIFIIIFLYLKFGVEYSQNFRIIVWVMWLYFFFLTIYITKLIHISFYFFNYLFRKISYHKDIYFNAIRLFFTAFVLSIMIISVYITPRQFEVTHIKVEVPLLPPAFNGYKIVQISDIHLGSWNRNYSKIQKIIGLVNEQKPDIIVFTGDMVNNFATEMKGWKPYFWELSAKDGNYAILGNHDYGDYAKWNSKEQEKENRDLIKQNIREFNFRLLLNENIMLHKGKDSLLLLGVENWGKTKKHRYSNLDKALKNTDSNTMKILLSHDPNHFDKEVAGKNDIVLTLSGHTHAGQMGIKINNKLYSPVSLIFKYWAGLYKVGKQHIYVNRGIGYIGLPMYIGVRPEITVLELIKKND